ncbi:MAG: MiaB/RimO family radical SAM methylthiotransferase [Patescibacteria group bacterium]|jgi:tRNA-2-methylthio-N6-dimethylallyladenosine synthase
MKYYLWIIGCQYNEWDGARVKYFLDQLDFLETKKPADAEIVIILACSVRQTAIDRIFGRIKNWKDKKILVGGCILDSDKKKFTSRGIKLFDSSSFESLAKLLPKDVGPSSNLTIQKFNPSTALGAGNTSNYVPIMIGCNNFCSYCAVPYTRGREKSRPYEDVILDVKALIHRGESEIMLLGQNVNSYKINQKTKPQGGPFGIKSDAAESSRAESRDLNSKLKSKSDFAILLEDLNDLPGNFIISFMSNHPKDMAGDIIEAVAILPKVKKEIHLPLQSGSDKILKAMNRPYTKSQYLKIIDKIRKANSDIKITTDVIVGFPGETEKDFEETIEVFKKVNFSLAYVNKYSPRSGTAAYKLGDPVLWSEKQRRWRILNDLVNKK